MAVRSLPVTVVVPTWRRPDWLRRCLKSVLDLSPPPDVVAVAGREDDSATRAVASEFPTVRWIAVDRPGFVAPIRAAAAAVETEFVAVIDDDAEPSKTDWLANLYDAMADDVACVGSRVEESLATPRVVSSGSGRVTWYGRILGNVAARSDLHPVDIDTLPEGNWMWRTDVLRRLTIPSIFDGSDASMYGCDLCLQAQRQGWRTVFTSSAPVRHYSAPRGDASEAGRDNREKLVYSYSRNVTYIALTHFRLKLLPFALWAVLIGDAGMPGIATALRDLGQRRLRVDVLFASTAGKVAGLRYWIRARSWKS